jgi:hypothetical protein
LRYCTRKSSRRLSVTAPRTADSDLYISLRMRSVHSPYRALVFLKHQIFLSRC